ncbi:MAG: hypothetical protein H6817_02185 [Phycisphaerales bacterium]|nr:hypothetical protein [Phycisphaerales bacterium]
MYAQRGLWVTCVLVGAVGVMCATPAFGGGHTWDVNEVFSSSNGLIQFVELREANGTPGEIGLNGKVVSAVNTGKSYVIPGNVVAPTSNKMFLLATQSFADLPGAPTPDRIIPPGSLPFFDVNGDSVKYHVYDTWVFGAVPTDGVNSMNRVGGVQVNSPTNYAGQTGSVDLNFVPGDFDGDGDVDLLDHANFEDCLDGPEAAPTPTLPGATAQDCLDVFDSDGDDDVDLQDFDRFQRDFGG